MQSGHRRIKKDERNNQSSRPFSGKLRNACQNPQKTRHDSDVQAGDGKEMKRARLLEWFFDGFRGLMSKTERDPVFGIDVITRCPGVPAEILVPRRAWRDPSAYDAAAAKLAGLFRHNFKGFEAGVSREIKDAGPA